MSNVKNLIKDLKKLDVSDCSYGSYFDSNTKCFCPLGKLAVNKGLEFKEYSSDYENSVQVIKYLSEKYEMTWSIYDNLFSAFTTPYDKSRKWKKGREWSKKHALKKFISYLKEKGKL